MPCDDCRVRCIGFCRVKNCKGFQGYQQSTNIESNIALTYDIAYCIYVRSPASPRMQVRTHHSSCSSRPDLDPVSISMRLQIATAKAEPTLYVSLDVVLYACQREPMANSWLRTHTA